jgi:lysyl-tRNA synthetase class I
MIYSAAFDGMPAVVRERVYQRLYEVLSGKDQGKKFAGITSADRQAVLEIVRATKPKLPEYWLAK